MNNDLYFMTNDLRKRLDPVAHYVDFFSKTNGTPKDIRNAIKVFKRYNELKEATTGWISYVDPYDALKKLKEILNTRYSIDKFPEYWV